MTFVSNYSKFIYELNTSKHNISAVTLLKNNKIIN